LVGSEMDMVRYGDVFFLVLGFMPRDVFMICCRSDSHEDGEDCDCDCDCDMAVCLDLREGVVSLCKGTCSTVRPRRCLRGCHPAACVGEASMEPKVE
jgi:hypothetical protein